jgi:phage gp29-like protein
MVPTDIIGKPPNWFVFDENNALRMRTKAAPVSGEELPPMKFLLPRQDATYDNPYGFPDLSMCFWPTTFKKAGLKFWVAFTEKYGTPWVVGKHPRSASDAETELLLDSLEAMVQDAVAAIPDDASIEIMNAASGSSGGGNVDAFERLLRFCRSEVSIALLGQNQTTESDANRASAQAGLEVTRDIRDGDKAIIIDMMNTLIWRICDLNFGDVERPVFDLWEQEEVDKVLAERDEVLTRAGARFSNEYFLRTYGLQEGDLMERAQPQPEEDSNPSFSEAEGKGSDALDQLIEAESANWQPLFDPMLAPIQAALDEAAQKGETAAEFLARLPALLGQMDAGPLAEELTKMAFVARAAGLTGTGLE